MCLMLMNAGITLINNENYFIFTKKIIKKKMLIAEKIITIIGVTLKIIIFITTLNALNAHLILIIKIIFLFYQNLNLLIYIKLGKCKYQWKYQSQEVAVLCLIIINFILLNLVKQDCQDIVKLHEIGTAND